MTEPRQLLVDIREARSALESGAASIAKLTLDFEGRDDENKVWVPGPKWRYKDAVLTATLAIREQFDGKPPNAALVEQIAERKVKEQDPQLWHDYHRLASQIEATKLWLSAKKEAVSALQSELSTERALAR